MPTSDDPTLRQLIAEQFESHQLAHIAHDAAHEREHVATERAIEKAEQAIDKRLEGIAAVIAQLDTSIGTEREERRANEGVKRGMGQTTTIIVAAIGLVGTVLGIVIILSNVLTSAAP